MFSLVFRSVLVWIPLNSCLQMRKFLIYGFHAKGEARDECWPLVSTIGGRLYGDSWKCFFRFAYRLRRKRSEEEGVGVGGNLVSGNNGGGSLPTLRVNQSPMTRWNHQVDRPRLNFWRMRTMSKHTTISSLLHFELKSTKINCSRRVGVTPPSVARDLLQQASSTLRNVPYLWWLLSLMPVTNRKKQAKIPPTVGPISSNTSKPGM